MQSMVEPVTLPIEAYPIVTSLNPRDRDRQRQVLDSWRKCGLSVVVVQPSDEISELQPAFPDVTFIETLRSNRGTVYIEAMLNVVRDRRFVLLNSDVEIIATHEIARKHLFDVHPLVAVLGRRWNYTDDYRDCTPEVHGIDCFSLTPSHVNRLQGGDYEIGKPWWDWWLPYELRRKHVSVRVCGSPILFHQIHGINWSDEDYVFGRDLMTSQYGRSVADIAETVMSLQAL